MRRLLAWSLRERGFHVTEVEDGAELDRRLALSGSAGQSERFDLVISDIRMPGKSGLEVLKSLQARGAAPAAILITAFGDEPTHREAEQMGLVLLDKPFDIQDLVKSAESALRSLLDRETTEEAHE